MSSEPNSTPGAAAAASVGGFLDFEKPLLRIQQDIEELEREQAETGRDLNEEIKQQRTRLKSTLRRLYSSLTPWETVQVARHPKRPLSTDYLKLVFRDFCELHGDRVFGDDRAILTGFARVGPHKVAFVGHSKGREVRERITCNFGCAHPEGYRKSLRLMRLAEKFRLPVVCIIDTQGAYPGIGSEERGVAQAIATNLMEMSRLRTPVVCVVIGEGGSGGALGIGVGDRVAMLEHAFYSVISPEGCAAILWKTAEHRKQAAEALHLTAKELLKLGIIDHIIPEPLGGAHREPETTATNLEKYVVEALSEVKRRTIDTLLRRRYERIRALGSFFESPSEPKPEDGSVGGTHRRTSSRAARLRNRLTTGTSPES
ncbi:MAG TPA: acetyl-CoA carboxylase carboxyltransferase subunit alpha [Phycisphaerae bacterium]|nr:acetyl-CoA carboxylase carboxyltransferase subunit alpha [Phycisphaerae bacterium]HNU45209.1 acetyl-CoA carboxylase carboxyltransferase subunit alpha [Phycisphaerae bacterium]